jgi:hypothetical protein
MLHREAKRRGCTRSRIVDELIFKNLAHTAINDIVGKEVFKEGDPPF